MPRPDRGLDNPKIWEFFDENEVDMFMWTGIDRRFDETRFYINGTPTYAPLWFKHNDRNLNDYVNISLYKLFYIIHVYTSYDTYTPVYLYIIHYNLYKNCN